MKYNKVYYYDKNDTRKEFFSKNLDTKENIASLKEYEILDDTETIHLTPVDFVEHKTRKSFFKALSNQTNRLFGKEQSEIHDLKTSKVFDYLLESDRLKIWSKDFNGYPPIELIISKIQNYQWNFEVTREIINSDKNARFDIYGTCKNGTLSPKRPEIIIEIIDTHFLDKNLFLSILERTKQLSTIVLFYFIENENFYNKMIKNDLRVSAFMRNGAFYYGGIKIKEPKSKIQDDIENKYIYFNYINQNFIKQIRKGNILDLKTIKKENAL
jgi:hypothetical protein